MKGSYLGPDFSSKEIENIARKYKANFKSYDEFSDLALLISKGNAVGWFQGRMEFGPRAFGCRSILGDPRNPETQLKLNMKIKYIESFRPFAPSVLEEDCGLYFDYEGPSPYMLTVHPIRESIKKQLPENYEKLSLKEKLYTNRSYLQSITHVDYSSRIQTVQKETNYRYYELISSFKELTGYGVIVNTSFNVRGEPIVCTPEDAYKCFMRTEMDYLVIGDYVFDKSNQPILKDEGYWKDKYVLD